jgi:hypothetical protein
MKRVKRKVKTKVMRRKATEKIYGNVVIVRSSLMENIIV